MEHARGVANESPNVTKRGRPVERTGRSKRGFGSRRARQWDVEPAPGDVPVDEVSPAARAPTKEAVVLIATVLRSKGEFVATVVPSATVQELLETLAEHRIGAVVVSSGAGIAGIVSERDVVRRLRDDGAELLRRPVARIMTTHVVTCRRETSVEELMATMTERRIRHVPVVDDHGALVGIVSIGDLVKCRISELESERDDLVGYIGTR
jgi:CBS domain-containing protein